MLILSRAVDEEVWIEIPDGRTIRVRVVALRFGKVRIGFEADDDIAINREEIARGKQRGASTR